MVEIPDQEAWCAWRPHELAARLAGVGRPWCVVGGWALDLWHGRVTREHHDLEFTVLREDFGHFRRVLADDRKDPLWPAGHVPHKGGDELRHAPAPNLGTELSAGLSPSPCGEGLGGEGLGGVLSPKTRDDRPELFSFYAVNSGTFQHLPDDQRLDPSITQIWCWDVAATCWRVDIMIEPGTPDIWVCKRHHAIKLPRSEAIRHSHDGIPHLAPAAILLLKAKHLRPKDEADFEMALPKLDASERSWLGTSLAELHPDHVWIDRL